jgi:hypothetical protein
VKKLIFNAELVKAKFAAIATKGQKHRKNTLR